MKIGIALSGGGARCVAQLGYLDRLYTSGIIPQSFAGSSGGAIVGALLARGLSPKEALEFLKAFPFHKIRFNLFGGSLFNHLPLYEELKKRGFTNFKNLQKPLFVTLTDYKDGTTYYKHSGDLAKVLLATTALIPLFPPVKIETTTYIDGGFTDNLPLAPLDKRDFLLAINVNPRQVNFKKNFWGNFKRAGYIMLNANIRSSLALANHYVEIQECQKFGILEKKAFDTLFHIGQEYGRKDIKRWETFAKKF